MTIVLLCVIWKTLTLLVYGDSIVVAPSQTLSNDDYYRLRQASLRIIRHLGVVGECNVQYALDPHSDRYCVIEVNARLSRSSAQLKGYRLPLAYVAAKLSREDLAALKNRVTTTTTACYEPSLDAMLLVKIPRWDLSKFPSVDRSIGSAMKSVGEVMAIGRTFPETIQKAARMVTEDPKGLFRDAWKVSETENTDPSESRLLSIIRWLYQGSKTGEECIEETRIDRWFISSLVEIVEHYRMLEEEKTFGSVRAGGRWDASWMLRSKQLGFSDWMIARACGLGELEVRKLRIDNGIIPKVKQIDTTGGEFPKQNKLSVSKLFGIRGGYGGGDGGGDGYGV